MWRNYVEQNGDQSGKTKRVETRRRSSLNQLAIRRKSSTAGKKTIILRVQSPTDQEKIQRFGSVSDGEAEVIEDTSNDKLQSEPNRRSKSLTNSRNTSPLAFDMTSAAMFDKNNHTERPAPELPTIDEIEYPRAASWSSSTVEEILRDPMGRQVFRCFLFESLAEENLLFVEAIEQLQREKDPENIRNGIKELLDKYGQYINLSSTAMGKLKDAAEAPKPDQKALEHAHKEISKLLENDQFPRFRRSTIYIEYLEKLLPKAYAERWATSFEAMLGNQVGRHHFRQYLFSVHAEENLRFWEAVVEFRATKNKSQAMLNMGRTIQEQYLREGAHNEVYLPFGVRQQILKRIREKTVDETLFDDAVKHVEQILKNDPYVRFLQSKPYIQLMAKLTR
ncbi:Regulator of G-protein signaling rgs-3 [Aphelenchoides bicaudatus]|nr:Regulator of G-protein signaling rgs-3 [Aphelenchoides bicaudatus]